MANLTSIQRKQRALYGGTDPLGLARTATIRHRAGLGYFGAAGASVYSGPPVGSGARGGATTGAVQGATVGAVAGPIGAAIGAAIGAIGGAIAGSLNKRDPEQANFDQAVALWQQNRLSVLNLSNLYLPLAGLFDLSLKNPHIPIYQKYGRMGEQKFVTDLMTKVYQAAQAGTIGPNDTAQTIMVKVVQPWIDSWGFGPMADPHADLINILMMGMIADYTAGLETTWKARGGDYPFGSLPKFSLPGGTSGSTAAQYAAGTAVATAPVSQLSTTAAAQPPVSQTYSNERATITVGVQPSTVAIQDSAGNVVHFAAPTSGATTAALIVNGTVTNQSGASAAIHNGQIYVRPATGGSWGDGATTYLYSNGTWSQVADPFATASGSSQSTSPSGYNAIGTANGVTAYQGPDGNFYSWNGTAMLPITGTVTASNGTTANVIAGVAQSTTASGTTASGTTVAVPAGYTLIGTANGLAAYQGLDGNYYSWNGATMSLLTGTLTASNGQSAYISNGVLQPTTTASLSTGAQQTQQLSVPSYQTYAPAASTPAGGSSGNAPAQPATAGVSTTGLPSWLTWGAIAAGAYFMFATARPVGKIKMPKKGRQ